VGGRVGNRKRAWKGIARTEREEGRGLFAYIPTAREETQRPQFESGACNEITIIP